MFQKVLIANRGEIALRIIRTCRRLGISTVAIFSEVEKDALHSQAADEAFCVGKPKVSESYLNSKKIIQIAREAGVDAIHPGYGLLSENSSFAKECAQAGITFIGPSPQAIHEMGDKVTARSVMKQAGIPVIQGSDALETIEEALAFATEIGYPVMLKASAGGGGIGMQVVHDDYQLTRAFEGNQKRALAFFGNGTMYLEKYVVNPRHIEVQVLADRFGNFVHLWERECSIQRRHQKVIEEAPSQFLQEEERVELGELAIRAAKSIDYVNAGTVEFLVDEKKNYYFLEMNTRLQVEHPVTEEITGLDLVEEQLKIAAGEKLTVMQEDILKRGHAIEARIYAEDPLTFFPSPGKITGISIPEAAHIRHELGVRAGTVLTPYYDPMIGKLVVSGSNRQEAITKLSEALDYYTVDGIKTNIPFLKQVVASEPYWKGEITTSFVEHYFLKKRSKE